MNNMTDYKETHLQNVAVVEDSRQNDPGKNQMDSATDQTAVNRYQTL